MIESLNENCSKQMVIINVNFPVMDHVKGVYTYMISGRDSYGQIQIRHRYNDFYYLRQTLKKIWPGSYIPPVPQKMITGNKDEGNIQIRRRYFEHFLRGIAQKDFMWSSSITQQFLRNKKIDMQKFYINCSFPKPEQLIKSYKSLYFQLKNFNEDKQQWTLQQKKILTDFSLFLAKASKHLKSMKHTLQQIVESRNEFVDNLIVVTSCSLPNYENNVFSHYISQTSSKQQMSFVSRPKVQSNLLTLKQVSEQNSLDTCLDMIAYQILEIEAMLQLIENRNNFQDNYYKCNQKLLSSESQLVKLLGGKTTLKSFFSKGNKEQQIKNLEKQLPTLKEDVEQWRKLCCFISVLITDIEIPRFKQYKRLKYYDVMHSTSQKQLNYLAAYGNLMKSLIQGILKVE